jgi:hypothetical protein
MAETAAAVAVEAVTGTATKRSASTAAALACASVLMALADVVGLEVGEDASAQAELSSSVRHGGVNLAGAVDLLMGGGAKRGALHCRAVSGQETKFRTGTVPVNLPSIYRN